MFLMNSWYVAAWDHELIDGKLLARTILGKPVLLYKGESGRVVALDNRCCHRGAKLSNGRMEGDDVRCMYHGLKFDPSGKCIQIPGQDNIPPKLGVRSYPVVERQHLIWIWMGEAAKADPAKILEFTYLRDPAWRGKPDYMHYDANYLLIVDNLSDFAHLAFVHTKTLGGSEEYAFKSKPTAIERLPDGFRVERWHMDAEPPPFHRKVVREQKQSGPPQHRAHVRAGHLLHGDAVLARGLRRARTATWKAPSNIATASSSRRRPSARRISSGITCTTTTCRTRPSRSR